MDSGKLYIAMALIFLIAISGCSKKSGGEEDIAAPSAVLTRFEFDPASVFPGDLTFLEIEVQNNLEFEIEDMKIMLFNPPFGDCAGCWKIESVSPPCTALEDFWACIGNLRPGDKEFDIEGETRIARWNIRAPEISESSSQSYEFFARVHYKYKTIGISEITLINRKELTGNVSRSIPEVKNSNSPVKFSITTQSPIVISDRAEKINICIKPEKVGDEVIYSPNVNPEDFSEAHRDMILVSVELSGTGQKRMLEMNLNSKRCFEFSSGEVRIKKTLPVIIRGDYRVYKDFSREITVK